MSDFVRASSVPPESISWVIDGLIPRKRLTLVAGRPGEGKSLLEVWATAEATNHGEHVILSNVEDTVADQRLRLEAAGAVIRRVTFADPDDPLFIPRDVEKLERKIKQTRAGLVVLDTASRHVTTSIFDPQDCQRALGPLARMAERCNVGVILIHHLKGAVTKNQHPLEAIGGARGGLVGTCRFVYVFGKHDGDPDERVLAPVKVNNARDDVSVSFELGVRDVKDAKGKTVEAPYLLKTNPLSKVNAKAVVAYSGGEGDAGGQRSGKLVIAKDWLLATLMAPHLKGAEETAIPTTDLQNEAQQAGISWATVRRALKDDHVRAEKVRRGYGRNGFWAWKLPDDHPAVKIAARSAAAGRGVLVGA